MKIKFLILFVLLLQISAFFSCKKDESNKEEVKQEQNVDVKEEETVLPQSIQFTSLPSDNELYEAATFKLKYKVSPSEAEKNFDVTFSSSNPDVAKVSSSGNITALKAGKTTITAEINGIKEEFKLTVLHVVISGFDVLYDGNNIVDKQLIFSGFETKEINLDNLQSDNKHASYSMLNFDYDKEALKIIVDNQTVSITPLKVGNTSVKVFTSDIEKSFDIKVNAIKATSMTIDKNSLEVKPGENISLNVSLLPENTTDKFEDLNLTWTKTGDLDLSINDNLSTANVKIANEQASGVSKATIEVSATGLGKVSCNLVYISDFELEFVLFDESGKVVETYADNIPLRVPYYVKICVKGTTNNIVELFDDVEFEITDSQYYTPVITSKKYFNIDFKNIAYLTDTPESQKLKVKISSINKEFSFNLVNNVEKGLYLETFEDYDEKYFESINPIYTKLEKNARLYIYTWKALYYSSGDIRRYAYSLNYVMSKYLYDSKEYYHYVTGLAIRTTNNQFTYCDNDYFCDHRFYQGGSYVARPQGNGFEDLTFNLTVTIWTR